MSPDAAAVLEEACSDAGLRSDGAELIRMGENALFRLPHDKVVVRIARGIDPRDRRACGCSERSNRGGMAAQGGSARCGADRPSPAGGGARQTGDLLEADR